MNKYERLSIERAKTAHPKLRIELLFILREANKALGNSVTCLLTDVYRDFEAQKRLYAKGRTRPGNIVTHAEAGESYHNYGLAVDFCLVKNRKAIWSTTKDIDNDNQADWMEVVKVFKKHGWQWGGDWRLFKDYPHFQKTFGSSTERLLRKYKSGNVDAKGYVTI